MPSKSSKPKRKSSKRTTLKPYEVAMLLFACGGGHVNPEDAVENARASLSLADIPCPTGMVKTKTGGCRKKRKTKPRKTKPRKKLTEGYCKGLGKVLNEKTGRCNKRKTQRALSVYNQFVRKAMQYPEVQEKRTKEAKMLAIGEIWRQEGVEEKFYADLGVPMPSRRKTFKDREAECIAAGKQWTGKRCKKQKQKMTADKEDAAAREHDPKWWLDQGLVPPMYEKEVEEKMKNELEFNLRNATYLLPWYDGPQPENTYILPDDYYLSGSVTYKDPDFQNPHGQTV